MQCIVQCYLLETGSNVLRKYECLFSGNIIYKNNAGPIEIRIAPITRY